ncbi:PRC-barrel domain-containing protein [Sporosarcina ureae]|uniref:PRC-barrel domain-containing protein n=1 Tax=Sporosarcina ureae TaxID=1571 RepID=UPI0026ED1F76|nr:YlmC/YmxH family sporulation protein [Sporosarcina ureae]
MFCLAELVEEEKTTLIDVLGRRLGKASVSGTKIPNHLPCDFSLALRNCKSFFAFSLKLTMHSMKEGGETMRFSSLQKKEVIELKKGSFLGFVQDATIDIEKGQIAQLHIGELERSFFTDSKSKGVQKIDYKDVMTIGKDIILIDNKQLNK